MQERAWEKRGAQYLLIKSPPASGKSRALMFIALDKLTNQGVNQAIVVLPERTIGASFTDVPLGQFGLLMEQVLAPRFKSKAKTEGSVPEDGLDYGVEGYNPARCNVGVNQATGEFTVEIKGLVEPKSEEAARICREDLTELHTTFLQDRDTLERGLFDQDLLPEEITQLRMGKIVQEKFPDLDKVDQEAVREHAIAAMNLFQQAKRLVLEDNDRDRGQESAGSHSTALIDGVRRYVLNVRDLDIDLIDRINPFGEAYAILAKAMNENSLKQVADVITAKKVRITPDEARALAKRALQFKRLHDRLPSATATDPWERRMAKGVAKLQQMATEDGND